MNVKQMLRFDKALELLDAIPTNCFAKVKESIKWHPVLIKYIIA